MCYTLEVEGHITIDRPLTPAQLAYLKKFCERMRLSRDPIKAAKLPDPLREAVKLPIGEESEYYIGTELFGMEQHYHYTHKDETLLEPGKYVHPKTQPGTHCFFRFTDDGVTIHWGPNGTTEKSSKWLEYLVQHFFKPWGYTLNGRFSWDSDNQKGFIAVTNNEVQFSESVVA